MPLLISCGELHSISFVFEGNLLVRCLCGPILRPSVTHPGAEVRLPPPPPPLEQNGGREKGRNDIGPTRNASHPLYKAQLEAHDAQA